MAEVAKSTGVSEGREKPEQGQSSSPTEQAKLGSRRALQCPPEPLWALTTNQARILWNAPEFPHGPSFSSWVQALASQGTEFRSQLGPSLAAQGIPDVPPPHTHTHRPSSGNSGASCCLGCRAKDLPLGSHPQRPRVDIQAQRLPTRLDNCYFSEGEGRRQVEVEGEEKRAWEAGTAGIMVLWFLSQCLSPATRDIPTLQPRPCTVRAGIPGHVSTLGCLLTKCMTLP